MRTVWPGEARKAKSRGASNTKTLRGKKKEKKEKKIEKKKLRKKRRLICVHGGAHIKVSLFLATTQLQ